MLIPSPSNNADMPWQPGGSKSTAGSCSPHTHSEALACLLETNFGESLGGSQATPSFWKSPDFPGSFPNFPEVFQRLPRKFSHCGTLQQSRGSPEVSQTSPKVPRTSPEVSRTNFISGVAPLQIKPKKGQFMNFSQGHSGTKVRSM